MLGCASAWLGALAYSKRTDDLGSVRGRRVSAPMTEHDMLIAVAMCFVVVFAAITVLLVFLNR